VVQFPTETRAGCRRSLDSDGKLYDSVFFGYAERLGAVVSNGRIFYMSQASGFVVSQTYGEDSKSLPAVWEAP
jgi:hypothetical protein